MRRKPLRRGVVAEAPWGGRTPGGRNSSAQALRREPCGRNSKELGRASDLEGAVAERAGVCVTAPCAPRLPRL